MDMNGMNRTYESLGISREVREFVVETEKVLRERFEAIDAVTEYNQMGVIKGMQDNRVSDIHLAATTGHGYNDLGRDTPEDVYVNVFHGEGTLVRPQSMGGTHTLHMALSGNLRLGDEPLSPVGKPHDTLEEVIEIRDSVGSFKGYEVICRQVDLSEDGSSDYEGITTAISERIRLVTMQRSKEYATRPTLSVKRIGELISFIKNIKPGVTYMVDNCYGELVETLESTDVRADMIIGSLIKNPSDGLAPISGYIVDRKDCIERTSYRLSAPGLGKEIGINLGSDQQPYQGFLLSSAVVSGTLKGAIFAANIYERLGCGVVPDGSRSRHDAIQVVTFGMPEGTTSFCKRIQTAAPVDSYVTPESWGVPEYDSPVIMVAGALVQGSSIEPSIDDPIKPPYAMYFQEGSTWYHAKLGIFKSSQQLLGGGVLKILR